MNIFSKAAQNLPLSPAQRAFLKLLKGWMYTALIAGLVTGGQYLGTGQLDWIRLLYIVGGAIAVSLLISLEKFFTAQGDVPLALATQAVEKQVQQKIAQQTTPLTSAPKPILFPVPTSVSQAPAVKPSQFQGLPASNPNDLHFGDTNVGLPTV